MNCKSISQVEPCPGDAHQDNDCNEFEEGEASLVFHNNNQVERFRVQGSAFRVEKTQTARLRGTLSLSGYQSVSLKVV